MKTKNRKPISFVMTMALLFSCFFPATAVYGADPIPEPAETKAALSDIGGHWGEDVIQKAVKAGFVQGYEDGSFKPNTPVKRAEFISMVNQALGLRDDNTLNLNYSDVKKTDWYYKAIQKASYAGYVSGVSETSFMPKKNITRQEAAAMLARILPGDGSSAAAVLSGYPDAAMISSWAKDAMAQIVGKGYLKGYSNGTLSPSGTLTRAEAAKIIGIMLEKETIVREDVSLKNANETLRDKIYIGNIVIEKSVGEGDATLENLTALGKVYVLGGGTNTVTIKDATIIQLIVCKEGTKVRVLTEGDTSIHEAFLFNDNLLVNQQGQNAETGDGSYSNVIRLTGTISAETAIKIANELANRLAHTGTLTQEQVLAAVGAVAADVDVTIDSSGNINIGVTVPDTNKKRGGGSASPTLIECSCGLSHTSDVVLTEIVAFNPTSPAGIAVTGYAIYTEAQLQHLAMHLDSNAILMNDLDFTEYEVGSGNLTPMGALKDASAAGIYTSGHGISSFETGKFVPIGSSGVSPYRGMFYGNGKTVTGLIVSGSAVDNVGLFGYTSGAAISDLNLRGGIVKGKSNIGGLVGYAKNGTVSAISNAGEISGNGVVGGVIGYNIGTVSAIDNAGEVSGTGKVGGVIGNNVVGTLMDSYNTGEISGTDIVGGVVGTNSYAGTVKDCYNAGSVDSSFDFMDIFTGDPTGGVVGHNNGTLTNSYNTGTVNANNYDTGGVVGINDNNGIVHNCHNTGMVTSVRNSTGGVAGQNKGAINSSYNKGEVHSAGERTGGVAGHNNLGRVESSYNTGSVVSERSNAGGVAGVNDGVVTGSHNTGAVFANGYVGGIVGYNDTDVINSFNAGSVHSTNGYTGGVVGYNKAKVDGCYNAGPVYGVLYVGGIAGTAEPDDSVISNSYNTGAINSTGAYTGGVVGHNKKTVQNCYNTGAIKALGFYKGSIVGYNDSAAVVENVFWLDGTHTAGIGNSWVIETISFGGASLPAIYTSIEAVQMNAGGVAAGVIDDLIYTGDDVTPDSFSPLQGSYKTAGNSLTMDIDAAEDATITVTTGSSLGTLLLSEGNEILPTTGSTYEISDMASNTWVLIRAIYEEQPEKNRYYTIYKP